MLIGLCGLARSGKDTCAAFLTELGYQKYAFADELRSSLYELNPIISGEIRLKDAVYAHGWDGAKQEFPEVRRLMQVYGTEVVRRRYGESFWVDILFSRIDYLDRAVITDVRMVNEVETVKAKGGVIVWIDRPGLTRMAHASEQLDFEAHADHRIVNDGSIDEFKSKVISYARELECR